MATNDELLAQATGYWKAGDDLNAGRALFARLPPSERGRWACGVLRYAAAPERFRIGPVRNLLDLCDKPDTWRGTKAVFSRIRGATLKLEDRQSQTRDQDARLNYLLLAENVAKVMYNATKPPDEFDEDAGWWVAVCLRAFLKSDGVPDWEQKAWTILVGGGETPTPTPPRPSPPSPWLPPRPHATFIVFVRIVCLFAFAAAAACTIPLANRTDIGRLRYLGYVGFLLILPAALFGAVVPARWVARRLPARCPFCNGRGYCDGATTGRGAFNFTYACRDCGAAFRPDGSRA
jgi:hypothetical protein